LAAELRLHRAFESRFLVHPHDIIVYLPPGYEAAPEQRYPVLYLQDGQNLFDPATAFCGQEWRADETADELIKRGAVEPLIMAGVYNAGVERIDEYTPTHDRKMGRGGKLPLYARLLVDELRPFINRTYRTRPEREHTGIGGSSLGGLAALWVGLRYPHIYGKLAVLSPSVWWDERSVLNAVGHVPLDQRPQIWLDVGTQEGSTPEEHLADVRRLRDELEVRGWLRDTRLYYHEAHGAAHNENAWGERFGPMLQFLFPGRKAAGGPGASQQELFPAESYVAGESSAGAEVFTIGHSTRTMDELLAALKAYGIRRLVDIRHFPSSRHNPQFSRAGLEAALGNQGIAYSWLEGLGGFREGGYLAYMQTPQFAAGIHELERLARETRTAFMCAEVKWYRCHRRHVSDVLAERGWTVIHILNHQRAEKHYAKTNRIKCD